MSVLAILRAVLSLANVLMGYAKDKQLLDAGEAKAVNRGLENAMLSIDKARRARHSVKYLGGVPDPDDPNDRDTLRGP